MRTRKKKRTKSTRNVHKCMISLKQIYNEIECWLPGGLVRQMKGKLQWKPSKMGIGSFISANDLLWPDPHKHKKTRIFYLFALNRRVCVCIESPISLHADSFFIVSILLWKFIEFIWNIFFEINRLKRIKIDHIVTNRQSRWYRFYNVLRWHISNAEQKRVSNAHHTQSTHTKRAHRTPNFLNHDAKCRLI